jgi:hypothetical protein
MSLFIPTYFSPIAQYTELLKADKIQFELWDNYQKQSYRNRCYIFNTNGKQLLNIPVKHANILGRKKTKDVLIDNTSSWQNQHFKSLNIAYSNSPFFEFYVDDLAPLFDKKYKYLQDINIDSFLFIADALQHELTHSITNSYEAKISDKDFRKLAEKPQSKKINRSYVQMFDDKHGFIPNLSILDLLFMEGPNTINYL